MRSPELFDLTGRVALVTGAAGGLGRVIAEALVEAGARVIITSRRHDKLDGAVAELSRDGDVRGVICDVRDDASIEAAFDSAVEAFGGVDVLVANSGAAWVERAELTPRSAWTKVIETNLIGAFQCASRFARDAMARGEGGSIVLISSIAGQQASAVLPTSAYAASKAGINGLTRQLAVEWASAGITVNALAPGYFTGGMSDVALDRHRQQLVDRIPAGRFGSPDDLKGAVLFLASPASRYVTGQVLAVDGGQSAW